MLRKVLFKAFIPHQFNIEKTPLGADCKITIPGTGVWQKDFLTEGIFHQFGMESCEDVATDSIAIVELPDGTIESVLLRNLKFVTPILPSEAY